MGNCRNKIVKSRSKVLLCIMMLLELGMDHSQPFPATRVLLFVLLFHQNALAEGLQVLMPDMDFRQSLCSHPSPFFSCLINLYVPCAEKFYPLISFTTRSVLYNGNKIVLLSKQFFSGKYFIFLTELDCRYQSGWARLRNECLWGTT